VQQGAVVAVEALEGTDETIRRAGRLAGPGATVIKAARPHQDRRMDLPVVGPETGAALAEAGARGLALEAGSVLLVDREALVSIAEAAGIAVWGFAQSEDAGQRRSPSPCGGGGATGSIPSDGRAGDTDRPASCGGGT
jgi:DUF1009 family protein